MGYAAGLDKTTGSYNVFVGGFSGTNNTLGIDNVFVGFGAGAASIEGGTNVYLGTQSGSQSTGSGNVFIGRRFGYFEQASDKLYIENTWGTDPLIYGEFNNDLVGINGKLSVGTEMPSSSLHIRRVDGSAKALIEKTNATTSPRTLINIQNNGWSEIVMGNTGTDGEWSFGAGTNFILK